MSPPKLYTQNSPMTASVSAEFVGMKDAYDRSHWQHPNTYLQKSGYFIPCCPAEDKYREVVVKTYKKGAYFNTELQMYQELRRHFKPDCPVVPLFDWPRSERNDKFLVFEPSDFTLYDLVNPHGSAHHLFQLCMVPTILHDMLKGIEWLQLRHIVHGAIRPENIWIYGTANETSWDLKISNVSEACKTGDERRFPLATSAFLPPTLFKRTEKVDDKLDMWSIGVTIYDCVQFTPWRVPFGTSDFGEKERSVEVLDEDEMETNLQAFRRALGSDNRSLNSLSPESKLFFRNASGNRFIEPLFLQVLELLMLRTESRRSCQNALKDLREASHKHHLLMPQLILSEKKLFISAAFVYERIHDLGAGSDSTVYKCLTRASTQPRFINRVVAVKALVGSYSSHTFDEEHKIFDKIALRKKERARTTSSIQSGHIISLLDASEPGLFLVFEEAPIDLFDYVHALDSERRLAVTPEIIYEVLLGLEELHDCGIVHRDLKAENIVLVGAPGGFVVKIIDFGLAANQGEVGDQPWVEGIRLHSGALVQVPAPMGTLSCAPPEYITLPILPKEAHPSADIWCVGTLFTWCVADGDIFSQKDDEKAKKPSQMTRKQRGAYFDNRFKTLTENQKEFSRMLESLDARMPSENGTEVEGISHFFKEMRVNECLHPFLPWVKLLMHLDPICRISAADAVKQLDAIIKKDERFLRTFELSPYAEYRGRRRRAAKGGHAALRTCAMIQRASF